MQSEWIAKDGKNGWRQVDFSQIIDTKSETKHYVDQISEDEVIYKFVEGQSKMSSSFTKQFKKTENQWDEVKVL